MAAMWCHNRYMATYEQTFFAQSRVQWTRNEASLPLIFKKLLSYYCSPCVQTFLLFDNKFNTMSFLYHYAKCIWSQPFLLKFSEIHSNEFVLIKVVLETKNYLIDISRLLLQGACNKTLCWLCNKEWILMGQSLRIKTRIPWMTITSQAVYNVVKVYIFASRIPPRTQAVNETYFTTVC